jgi:hypothetical protein
MYSTDVKYVISGGNEYKSMFRIQGDYIYERGFATLFLVKDGICVFTLCNVYC